MVVSVHHLNNFRSSNRLIESDESKARLTTLLKTLSEVCLVAHFESKLDTKVEAPLKPLRVARCWIQKTQTCVQLAKFDPSPQYDGGNIDRNSEFDMPFG